MAVHLHSTIKAVPGARAALIEAVEGGLKPLMEGEGWRLLALYSALTGPINTLVALWEMDELEDYGRARAAVAMHPDFPRVRAALDGCIADETLVILDRRL